MQNHFRYQFIVDASKRWFVSRTDPNCIQLDHQMQLIDMQKGVEPTWIPNVAGYDSRDQPGISLLIQLANTAMTLLTMAAMPKFAAAALQETNLLTNGVEATWNRNYSCTTIRSKKARARTCILGVCRHEK